MKTLLLLFALIGSALTVQSQWLEKVSGTTQDLTDVYFPDETNGFAVGHAGTILKSTDGGESWNNLISGTSENLEGVFFLNSTTGFVVGDNIMLKTTDAGQNWIPVSLPLTQWFKDVEFIDAQTGFCVGYDGTILKTIDGGNTWVQKNSDCSRFLTKIQFPSANVGYATSTGYNSNFIKTTDGGETWVNDTIDASLIFGSIEAVYFTSETKGFIGSWYLAGLAKTTDGGASWADASGGNPPNLYSIDFANPLIGFAVGLNGLVMTTLDGGDIWSTETIAVAGQLNAVQAVSSTFVIAVGSGGKIFKNEQATNDLDKLSAEFLFTVYPNPCKVYLMVEVPVVNTVAQVSIIDLSGKHLSTRQMIGGKAMIDVQDLEVGMYVVLIDVDGRVSLELFVRE